jgi:hypothetical protein
LIPPTALSTSQTLTLAVILLSMGGLAMVIFAGYAFDSAKSMNRKIEAALDRLSEAAAEATRIDAQASGLDATKQGAANQGGSEKSLPAESAEEPARGRPMAVAGAAEHLRALADLAEKLGKASSPVASLWIATLPFMFAAALVAIDLLN